MGTEGLGLCHVLCWEGNWVYHYLWQRKHFTPVAQGYSLRTPGPQIRIKEQVLESCCLGLVEGLAC